MLFPTVPVSSAGCRLTADLASLREMEKKINKDMDDLLITDASVKKLTVNTLFERYMATKNIKERTKKNYIRMWDYRIRNTLGNIRVVDFKTSHVRTFFSSLSDEGLAHSTIKGLYGLLNPSKKRSGPLPCRRRGCPAARTGR